MMMIVVVIGSCVTPMLYRSYGKNRFDVQWNGTERNGRKRLNYLLESFAAIQQATTIFHWRMVSK